MRSITHSLRRSALALTALAALLLASAASAQSPERLRLASPDLKKFPTVSVALDARDASGGFLSGLKKEQVTLLENGSPVPLDSLKESKTPIDISVAIDAGASMAVWTPDGRSRYEVLSAVLDEWGYQPSSGQPDHFNLFASTSVPATDLSYRSDWLAAFHNLPAPTPDSRPSLASLTQAIQYAEDNPAAAGTTRVILWITSTPEGSMIAGLPDLATRAQKDGLRLFVWLVAPEVVLQSESAQTVQSAAEGTGGGYAGFSGSQDLPKLDDWFNPLRGQYVLTYTSRAHTGGDQTLAVRVDQPDGALTSAPQPYQIDLQPPNPILLSPPNQIQRTCPDGCADPAAGFTPAKATLRILVEFPDGHPRALAATRLYVDGQLAAERTAEPFTSFDWDLSGLTESGEHHLAVEAVDSLGMTKRSLGLPVQIQATIIRQTWWQKLLSQPGLVRGILIAAILVGLGAGGFLLRRRIPAWLARLRSRSFGRPRTITLTRARSIIGGEHAQPAAHPGRRPAQHAAETHPSARAMRLIPLGEDERPAAGSPIDFSGRELTLGSDSARAEVVIADPTVDPLHARLVWGADGCPWLKDAGSTAGVWVNAELVPPAGRALEHGDVIHLGRAAFRFELTPAPPPRQVLIEKAAENS